MEESGVYDDTVSVLDVLAMWPCAHAIFKHVSTRDLVRSERVSRRWLHAVHDYLRTTRNLRLTSGFVSNGDEYKHITIEIVSKDRPWSTLTRAVEKLGSYIVSLTTDCDDAELLRIVETNCPNLQHIELFEIEPDAGILNKFDSVFYDSSFETFKKLKQIALSDANNMPDILHSRSFQNAGFEDIYIENCDTRGTFLNVIKTDSLKSLNLSNCCNFDTSVLGCMVHNLQNLTSLGLDHMGIAILENVHNVLIKIPKLENLSLCGYERLWSKEKLLESFSRLGNLKRLHMAYNQNVENELIEVVVRDCKKLEYLDISMAGADCVRSIAAACRRPPPAVTTLCLGWIQSYTSEELAENIRQRSVVEELLALGCIELTPQWIEATARASRGPDAIELQLRQACKSLASNQPFHELIINLDSTVHLLKW